MINNSPEQIELRRAQDTLVNVGWGVIAFGLWSLIKAIGVLLLNKTELIAFIRNAAGEAGIEFTDDEFFTAMVAIVAAAMFLGMLLHLYVGRSAIREARGKRCFFLYIPIAVLMAGSSVLSIYLTIVNSFIPSKQTGLSVLEGNSALASILIEITSMIMLLAMAAAAAKVRRYKKRLRESGAAEESGV